MAFADRSRLLALAASLALTALAAGAQVSSPPLPAAPGAAAAVPPPPARWTAAQIRESFDQADSDSNGELTRAEAQRLVINPRSFEDMDLNKDGVLVRAEYESAIFR